MSVIYTAGWDYFRPDHLKEKEMICRACGSFMDVKRGVLETHWRGQFELPKDKQRLMDIFTCPNAGLEWHEQVIALKKLVEATPSSSLAKIYQADVDEILRTKEVTKRWTHF